MWKESILPPCSVMAGELRRSGEVGRSPTSVFTTWAYVVIILLSVCELNALFETSKQTKNPPLYRKTMENVNYRFWVSCALDHRIILLCHKFSIWTPYRKSGFFIIDWSNWSACSFNLYIPFCPVQNESTHPLVFQIESLTLETNNQVHLGRFSHKLCLGIIWINIKKLWAFWNLMENVYFHYIKSVLPSHPIVLVTLLMFINI